VHRVRGVLALVALGRTNRQVGTELFISEKTVSVHLSRIMAKLGATNRAEAVAMKTNEFFREYEKGPDGKILTDVQAKKFVNSLLWNVNVIIEAPLGAGKTDVLLRVVPRLLLQIHPTTLRRVVLTFSEESKLDEYMGGSVIHSKDGLVCLWWFFLCFIFYKCANTVYHQHT